MLRLLPAFLAPPHGISPDGDDRARAFALVATWEAAALAVTAAVIPYAVADAPPVMPFAMAAMALALIGLLRLNHLGRTTLAAWLLVASGLLMSAVVAFVVDGLNNPLLQMMPLAVLTGGLLAGRRAAGLFTAVAASAVGLLFLAESFGRVHPAHVRYPPAVIGAMTLAYFAITWGAIQLFFRSADRSLEQARQSLRALGTMQRRLDAALESGRIGVWECDLDTHMMSLGPRAVTMLGLAVQPWTPLDRHLVYAALHPDDVARLDAFVDTLRRSAGTTPDSMSVRTADGRHHLLITGRLVAADGDLPPRLIGALRDVTTEALATSERARLLRDLSERVKELRLLHAATALLAEAPPNHETMERLVGLMPSAWMHSERCGARITFGDIDVTSSGPPRTDLRQAVEFDAGDGPGLIEVWYADQMPPVGGTDPFLPEERTLLQSLADLIARAIRARTQEARNEALEQQLRQSQKMEALGTLAGGIAHDFNNILAAVSGNARLALEETADDTVRAYLLEIATGARRATDLVTRILMFSHASATARLAPIQLRQPIEDALAVVRAGLTPNIMVATEYEPSLPPALADAGQIHQVVMNLGSNAAYAMREAGGFLRIAVRQVTITEGHRPSPALATGSYLDLSVSDTGHGIPPDVRDRIFEPFFTTKGVEGTGLGLAVVYGIVREHHGAVLVESEVGVGTTFHVYLPAASPETATAGPAAAPAIVRGQGQHILYVDDEEALVRLTERVLTRMGYRCTGFSDPVKAVEAFCAAPQSFDAVITDLAMPELDGASLLRAMYEVRPDLPAAVTSGFGEAAAEEAMRGLRVPRLPKPASPEAFSAVLQTLLTPRS